MKDYEVGAFLNAFYDLEKNVRVQNISTNRFCGCFPYGSIRVNLGISVKDFTEPKINQSQPSGWCFGKTLKDVCDWLFQKALGYNPNIAVYLYGEQDTDLEPILMEAHLSGWQFIIESVWDSGFDVYLRNGKVKYAQVGKFIGFPVEQIGQLIKKEIAGTTFSRVVYYGAAVKHYS